MAVCMLWLLTYVGQGLDLAVGNRPVIIVQGTQGQDYRHGNSIRKKSELNSIGSNLLHLRIYPSEASYQDDLSGNWLLFNDESRTSSWSPTSILIDDIIKEPKEFQTVFFALSPTVLNVLYSEYVTSLSHAAEPFVYDETNLVSHHQRTKKKWIDCKHSKSVISLPILVCDETGKQTLQESRQSNYDDLFEQKLNTATSLKTDLTYGRSEPSREFQDGEFVSRAFVYETSKLPGKRNQVFIGRRSIDQGESVAQQHQSQVPATSSPPGTASIASQLMLRSTRGSIQYDVPQIECPVSSDGMERFACPNPDRIGRYHCIDDNVLCDGFIDCPTGEDEDRHACMFYKTTKAHLDVLADAILRWARGR